MDVESEHANLGMRSTCARVFNVPGPKGATGAAGTNGTDGKSAYTTLFSGFTMPAIGGTVVAEVADATWIIPSASVGLPGEVDGHVLVVQFAGSFLATAIVDGTHVTLYNLGYTYNAVAGTAIPAGAAVAPGGAR